MTHRLLIRRLATVILTFSIAAFVSAAGPHGDLPIEPPDGNWNVKLEQGLAAARKPGMPTMVLVSATWCPDCKRMKAEVLNKEAARKALNGWDLVYVDHDRFTKIAADYKVLGIPTMIALDSNGLEMTRVQDDVTLDQFVKWAMDMQNRSAAIARLDSMLKANPKDAQALKAKGDAETALGLYLFKVESRVMQPIPARLDMALDCYAQFEAAGGKAPKDRVEFIKILQEGLKTDMSSAAAKLADFVKNNPESVHAADAIFWQGVFARVQNYLAVRKATQEKKTPPEVDYKAISAKFQDYLNRYPEGRYASAAKRILPVLQKDEARQQARKAQPKPQAAQPAPAKKS